MTTLLCLIIQVWVLRVAFYITYKFIEAEFVERQNRFLIRAKLKGNVVDSHLQDPGRLKELLIPGARLLLKKENPLFLIKLLTFDK